MATNLTACYNPGRWDHFKIIVFAPEGIHDAAHLPALQGPADQLLLIAAFTNIIAFNTHITLLQFTYFSSCSPEETAFKSDQ